MQGFYQNAQMAYRKEGRGICHSLVWEAMREFEIGEAGITLSESK